MINKLLSGLRKNLLIISLVLAFLLTSFFVGLQANPQTSESNSSDISTSSSKEKKSKPLTSDIITDESNLSDSSTSSSKEKKPNSLTSDIITDKRKQEIIDFIKESEPDWHAWEFQQYDSFGPQLSCGLAASDEMCAVGIEGVPVLAELLITESPEFTGSFLRNYLTEGMYIILRINADEATGCKGSYKTADCIADFYSLSKTECPKIISSDKSVKDNIAELRKYGVYAIPYVVKEIENGFDEYATFFTEIGLHLSAQEYAHLVIEKHLYSNDVYDDSEYNKGSEGFDYKAWLSENEEDLNNLFKFLDAYCAEYEAEQNTK